MTFLLDFAQNVFSFYKNIYLCNAILFIVINKHEEIMFIQINTMSR